MQLINDILTAAVKCKASDIHLNAGLPPMFRLNTIVEVAPGFPVMDIATLEAIAKDAPPSRCCFSASKQRSGPHDGKPSGQAT